MRKRARLGASSQRHRDDAARDYDVASRTARLAVEDARQGNCADAFRHAIMAAANLAAGRAHSVSAGEQSPYSDAYFRDLGKYVSRAEGAVKRRCISKR